MYWKSLFSELTDFRELTTNSRLIHQTKSDVLHQVQRYKQDFMKLALAGLKCSEGHRKNDYVTQPVPGHKGKRGHKGQVASTKSLSSAPGLCHNICPSLLVLLPLPPSREVFF